MGVIEDLELRMDDLLLETLHIRAMQREQAIRTMPELATARVDASVFSSRPNSRELSLMQQTKNLRHKYTISFPAQQRLVPTRIEVREAGFEVDMQPGWEINAVPQGDFQRVGEGTLLTVIASMVRDLGLNTADKAP